MKRQILGLGDATRGPANQVPDGLFLVRVERVQYRWHSHKPFYILRLSVLSPSNWAGRTISGRLYCTPKALWKLSWFLRDFGYDSDLFGCDEIDKQALIGLRGVRRSCIRRSTALPCPICTPSLQLASGKACQRHWPSTVQVRSWLHDLQLHADQPVFDLSPQIS